jgi:hypothetical protein
MEVSFNNKGNMSLTNTVVRHLVHHYLVCKEGQFVLKVLNADIKAKKVRDGYVLHVANQTETLSID